MKTKTKKFTQTDFANLFTKVDQPGVSRLLSGIDTVSFPLAVELAELFPSKGILAWKQANKEDIRRLFNQLKQEV